MDRAVPAAVAPARRPPPPSLRMNTQIDVRDVLPTIRVPTLLIYRTDDADVQVDEGRYIAERIPGARFVELPGADHLHVDRRHRRAPRRDRGVPHRRSPRTGPRPRARDRAVHRHRRLDGDARPRSGTARGATLLGPAPRRRSAASSSAGAAARSTPRATASSRPSTVRRGRSGARSRRSTAVRDLGLEIRAGLHTGEVEIADGNVRGIAVHIGSRVVGPRGPGRGPGLAHRGRPRRRLRHRARRTRRARAEGRARRLARVRRRVGLRQLRRRRRVGYASRIPDVGRARP